MLKTLEMSYHVVCVCITQTTLFLARLRHSGYVTHSPKALGLAFNDVLSSIRTCHLSYGKSWWQFSANVWTNFRSMHKVLPAKCRLVSTHKYAFRYLMLNQENFQHCKIKGKVPHPCGTRRIQHPRLLLYSQKIWWVIKSAKISFVHQFFIPK